MEATNVNNCLNSDIWLENFSQDEYGCHTPHSTNSLREKVCTYCDQRKPAVLEELAFSVILENAELLKEIVFALGHLPHRICWLIGFALNAKLISQALQLVPFVSEHGETRPSWFGADHSTNLWKFWLYCEVSQKLKPYMACPSAGIDKILHYFSNVDRSFLDLWSEMTSALKTLKAEIHNEDLKPVNSVICAEENKVVLVQTAKLTEDEFDSMKELQRLSKTFACPVVFKSTTIGLLNLKSSQIPHLLDDIDPKVIADIDIKKTAWSVAEIDEFGRVLLACNNLSAIFLRQKPTSDEVLEEVAPAVSRLLKQHHHLQKIGLRGFNLAGTLASYPLPPVEDLRLRECTFADEDWNFMANRSDLDLKFLSISSYSYTEHFPSLSIFLQNQAKSLVNIRLEYPTLTIKEICEMLKIMAKFNKLDMFELKCMEDIDFVSIEKIIVDFMSIRSSVVFLNDVATSDEEMNDFEEVVNELCKINQRPPITLVPNLYKYE